MTDDEQLIAEAERYIERFGVTSATLLLERLADALSAAVARNAELRSIFDGGFGDFEEDIKDREARRYREQLAAAAVRYRAEGWDEGANWAFEEITGDRPGQFLAPGDNPHRALLDENNETQED